MPSWLSSDVALKIFGPLVGAILAGIAQWGWRFVRDRRGWMAGEWDQTIPAADDIPARKDRVKCRHHGERVNATIVRVEPAENPPKKWEFDGALRQDGTLVGVFLGTEANRDSYGVIFMQKKDVNTFQGNYFRWVRRNVPGRSATQVVERTAISLEWKRKVRP